MKTGLDLFPVENLDLFPPTSLQRNTLVNNLHIIVADVM